MKNFNKKVVKTHIVEELKDCFYDYSGKGITQLFCKTDKPLCISETYVILNQNHNKTNVF